MKTNTKTAIKPINIELKGLKIFLPGSRETICFVSDVYADGVKFARAENDGNGGMTSVKPYEGKRDLFNKVEAYVESLPAEKSSYDTDKGVKKEYSIKMSLDFYIDKMVDAESNKKELEKAAKKAEKYMLDHLVFTELPAEENFASSYYIVSFGKPKRIPIADLLSRPDGIATIKKVVDRETAKGNRLVNTNIPKDLLK